MRGSVAGSFHPCLGAGALPGAADHSGFSLGALGDEATMLYAKLALAKQLYGDWYTDVDLAKAAQELNVRSIPISFS